MTTIEERIATYKTIRFMDMNRNKVDALFKQFQSLKAEKLEKTISTITIPYYWKP